MIAEAGQRQLWGESDRRRLVRLCAALSGDRQAAEDLAQETLLEAWRNVHKLRDPAGADRWLAAIARNVCLRWARRRARTVAVTPIDDGHAVAGDVDLDAALEHGERAALLDRALSLLPPETRDVLIGRYVDGSAHAEIGARLGLSDDAVSMRLTRGKAALRRLLSAELRDEAAAYGLLDTSDEGWRETRLWCSECGRRRLVVRRDGAPPVVAFRCPDCNPHGPSSEFRLENPLFARSLGGVTRPSAILARGGAAAAAYFAAGVDSGRVLCTRCGRPTPLRRYARDRDGNASRGLYARCARCGETGSSSVRGLALALPEVRQFRREHPRTAAVPERAVEFGGTRALLVRYESIRERAGIDVVFAHDTLRVLHVAAD